MDRYDAFPSDHIAVFLTKPTASISLYRDQDVPITKGCVAPKAYYNCKTVYYEFGNIALLLSQLLPTIQPTGLLQSHQQTGPNQSNVPQ